MSLRQHHIHLHRVHTHSIYLLTGVARARAHTDGCSLAVLGASRLPLFYSDKYFFYITRIILMMGEVGVGEGVWG